MADIEWEESENEDEAAPPALLPVVKLEQNVTTVKTEPSSSPRPQSSPDIAVKKEENVLPSPSPKHKTPEMRRKLREVIRQREAFLDFYDFIESQALEAFAREHHCQAKIANMSCQFKLGSNVDLVRMALASPNAELDPAIRNSLLITQKSPAVSIQVQKSGYVSILGGKTRASLYSTGRRIASIARRSKAAPDAKFFAFKVNNVVVTFKAPITFRLDVLNSLMEARAREINREVLTTYEKEIFPAMTVQVRRPMPISFKVFATGVFIAMGAEQVADVLEVVTWLYPLMQQISEDAIVSSSGAFGAFSVNPISIAAALDRKGLGEDIPELESPSASRKLGVKAHRSSDDADSSPLDEEELLMEQLHHTVIEE